MSINKLLSAFGRDRLGGQTVIAFAAKAWGALASFALTWQIAHILGPAGSGTFGLGITTITIFSFVALLGLDTILVKVVAGDLHLQKKGDAKGAIELVTRVVAVSTVTVSLGLMISRHFITSLVAHNGQLSSFLGIMICTIVPLGLQRIASASLRASGNIFRSQIIDGPLGTTLSAVGLLIWQLFGNKITIFSPAFLYLGGSLVACAVGWLMMHKITSKWDRAIYPRTGPLIVSSLPILASNLSNLFTEWYTTVSLSVYFVTTVVGQYRAAWQFVALAGLVQVAMDSVLGPKIAAAARIDDKNAMLRIARGAIVLNLALSSPLFLGIAIFPGKLMGIFGPLFVDGALALQILGIGQLVRLAFGPLGTILVMTGHQRWLMSYSFFAVGLCAVLCLFLVPIYGSAGAAMATTITAIFRSLSAACIVRYKLKISLFRAIRP